LKLISERSHVATLQGDFQFVDGAAAYRESLKIVELSINKASTFYGFCDFHDASLFPQLDHLDFSNPSKFFGQLIYRAAAFEKYRKLVAVDFSDQVRLLDKGADRLEQEWVQFQANLQKWSHSEGLKNLNHLLKGIEAIYRARSFDQIDYSYFVTERRLPFAGIGFFQPSMSMDGKVLQRVNIMLQHELFHSSPHAESVCIAAIPMKSSTLLCLCALPGQAKSRKFMDSVCTANGREVSAFLGAMMLSIENVYFTPSYLRALSEHSLALLKHLSSLGIAEDLRESDIRLARSVALFSDVAVVERATDSR